MLYFRHYLAVIACSPLFLIPVPHSASWHRIIAMSTPGMATQYPAYSQIHALERPMFAQSLYGILAARRGKSAGRRRMRRYAHLIETDGQYQQLAQETHYRVHSSVTVSCCISLVCCRLQATVCAILLNRATILSLTTSDGYRRSVSQIKAISMPPSPQEQPEIMSLCRRYCSRN